MAKQKALFEEAEEAAKAANAKAHEAKTKYEAAKFQVEAIKRKNCIEEIFWRFPIVGKQIIEKLDNQSLINCRSVSTWWQKFIEEKIILIRQIQKNISMSQPSVANSLQKISSKTLKEMVALLEWCQNRWEGTKQNSIQILFTLVEVRFTDSRTSQNINMHLDSVDSTLDWPKLFEYFETNMNYEPKKNDEISSMNHEQNSLFLIKLIVNNLEDKNPIDQRYKDKKHHEHIRIYTPCLLERAIKCNNSKVCQFIIENIADKNPSFRRGQTALHMAASEGNLSICEIIVKNTDYLHPLNKDKKTPLELAKDNGHKDVCNLINSAIIEQENLYASLSDTDMKKKMIS